MTQEHEDIWRQFINNADMAREIDALDVSEDIRSLTVNMQLSALSIILDYTNTSSDIVSELQERILEGEKIYPAGMIRTVEQELIGTDQWVTNYQTNISLGDSPIPTSGSRAAWGLFAEFNTFYLMRTYIGIKALDFLVRTNKSNNDIIRQSHQVDTRNNLLATCTFSQEEAFSLQRDMLNENFQARPRFLPTAGDKLARRLAPYLTTYVSEAKRLQSTLVSGV